MYEDKTIILINVERSRLLLNSDSFGNRAVGLWHFGIEAN